MPSEPATTKLSRHRQWEILGAAIAVIVLASVMEVREDQRVAFCGLSGYPAPELCPSRAWFGTRCPGCGLTRGMIYLAHGRWSAALEVHRLSILLAFSIIGQIPYRIYCLKTGRQPFGPIVPKVFVGLLIGALVINWLVGVARSPKQIAEPMTLISAIELYGGAEADGAPTNPDESSSIYQQKGSLP